LLSVQFRIHCRYRCSGRTATGFRWRKDVSCDQSRYDPFVPGRLTVNEQSMQEFDAARNRSFPCDIWRPTEAFGICPIILLSHSSGGTGRRGYTFLTNHLASHGYIVAGLNHSELVAPELERRDDETPEQRP